MWFKIDDRIFSQKYSNIVYLMILFYVGWILSGLIFTDLNYSCDKFCACAGFSKNNTSFWFSQKHIVAKNKIM